MEHDMVLPTGFEPVSQPRKGCMIGHYTTEALVSGLVSFNHGLRLPCPDMAASPRFERGSRDPKSRVVVHCTMRL